MEKCGMESFKKQKKERRPWFDGECRKILEERNRCLLEMINKRTEVTKVIYSRKRERQLNVKNI